MVKVPNIKFKFGWGGAGALSNKEAAIKAGAYAFGATRMQLEDTWDNHGHVICRADQFALFLIKRNEVNGQNNFQALEAEILPPEDPNPVLDVSKFY